MIKKYYLKSKVSFDDIKKKEGTFINNFSTIIDHDCDVYYQDDNYQDDNYQDDKWKVLLIFRKNIIFNYWPFIIIKFCSSVINLIKFFPVFCKL